jgi:hypothetical protein
MKLRSLLLAAGLLTASWSAAWELPKTGGKHPTASLQVDAVGSSLEDAKRHAFHQAIEKTVGVVVIDEKESSGALLTRDFGGSYSAGYIDDFEILESYQDDNNQWHVKINVQVASSKIAQRMMSSSEKNTVIVGERLQAQVESQLEEREQGDRLIALVLGNYPHNAYVINSGHTEFKINKSRQSYVEIPYEIAMSKFWLNALNEALTTASVKSNECGFFTLRVLDAIRNTPTYGNGTKKVAGAHCGNGPDMRVFSDKMNSYTFSDLKTLEMVNSYLQTQTGQPHLGLRVDMLDAAGALVDSRCANISSEMFIRYSQPNLDLINWNSERSFVRPDIVGQNKINGVLRVHFNNPTVVGDLARIRLNIQQTCT